MATHASQRGIDIGRVIRRTFETLGRNGILLLALGVILIGIPECLFQFLAVSALQATPIAFLGSPFFWGGLALTIVTSAFLQAAVTRVSVQDLRGERPQIGSTLVRSLSLVLPMIGLAFVTLIGLIIGVALLIVPGIIFYVHVCVSVPVLVEERRGIFGSIGRSSELTKGSRWQVVLLLLILLVVAWAFGFAFLRLLMPFSIGHPIVSAVVLGLNAVVKGVVSAAIFASLYVELRMVREGVSAEGLAAIFA